MRRFIFAVALLVLLIVSIPAGAADLQAGWYVKIEGVDAFQYQWDPYGGGYRPIFGVEFSTPPGQYEPFTVTDGPYHTTRWREVYVTENVCEVGSDRSLLLPINLGWFAGIYTSYVTLACQTNYDPNQMWLGLWHRKPDGTTTLLWSQQQYAGHRFADASILRDTTIEGGDYYFKLTVVPEPSSIATILTLSGMAVVCRRRR